MEVNEIIHEILDNYFNDYMYLYKNVILKIKTKYVVANDLITKGDLSERDIFKILKGVKYFVEDGDSFSIVSWLKSNDKNYKKKSIYNELFNRYPTVFNGVDNIKELNSLINYNIDELFKISKIVRNKVKDINNKHKVWNIDSFDTRESVLYDIKNNRVFVITFSIANLINGKKIAYAKKSAQANNVLLNKIKKEDNNRSKNSPAVNFSNINISYTNNDVKHVFDELLLLLTVI